MAPLDDNPNLAVISNDIQYIKRDLAEIKTMQQSNFVSKDEFEPIKKIVYGVVSLILVSVMGAIVALVVGSK